MENVYTYRLIGIKADGSDDVQNITASCETEAEIIIESFHDGDYYLLSESDDSLEDYRSQQFEAWASQYPDHSTIGDMLEGYR